MKVGSWKDVNWPRVWKLVLILFPIIYFATCTYVGFQAGP